MKRTNKEKILALVERMPPDVDLGEAVYRLELLRRVEIAREQVERGEVIDDEELEEWLMRDEQKETSPRMDDGSAQGPRGNQTVHRA
jgi:hypothetical protein